MTDTLEHETKPVPYPLGIPIEVCDLFERIALEIKGNGYRHYSARAILHRIRWHYHMDKHEVGFKANNNWTAPMARWVMRKRPELHSFFETREQASKAVADWIE